MSKIQIIYYAGMFGNLMRFILDRSLPDSNLKNIENPFTKEKNIHQPLFKWSDKFFNSHPLSPIPIY